MSKSDARAKAFRALDSLIEALDSLTDEEDAHAKELKELVESHERDREAELLEAARRIGEKNRKGGK